MGVNIEQLDLSGALGLSATGNTLNNVINGNGGANIITGGLGRDTMFGGAGRDVFDFNAITESGKTAATRDLITDFRHLYDKIDLGTIDANVKLAGNQAFKFIATAAFTHHAGELNYTKYATTTMVSGDINGDGVADFQIMLTGAKVLTAADFVL